MSSSTSSLLCVNEKKERAWIQGILVPGSPPFSFIIPEVEEWRKTSKAREHLSREVSTR